ncbi:type II toxin-antitoxin system HicB family antitoxin [Algoriphagus sp.]|uniref:type II toxin-antitoxin system HicB family antitoxin n=1 Tax=Algoriphagus sp. TaxID=1872435 RepID=UPI00391D10C7
MNKYEIVIYWSIEDDCFVAEVPELLLLKAHGDTQNEAHENAQQAIALWIEVVQKEGIQIPEAKGKLILG